MATGIPTRPGQERPSTGLTGPSDADAGAGGTDSAGAIPPSPDGDDIEDDPRVVAISLALQESADLWVQTVDGEVQLDTEVAAIIALATLGEGYCSEQCHDDEHNAIVERIRDFMPRNGTECSCRDEILAEVDIAGASDDPQR